MPKIEIEIFLLDIYKTTYYQEADENQEALHVVMSRTSRGKPAIVANGSRYTLMSENKQRILWRCGSMMNNARKCPARISMAKTEPPTFQMSIEEHIHAELKRGKYTSQKYTDDDSGEFIVYRVSKTTS